MTGSAPHLSFQPLYDAAYRAAARCINPDDHTPPRHYQPTVYHGDKGGPPGATEGVTCGQVAEQLGVSRRTLMRWLAEGSLSMWTADRVCQKALWRHPVEIWGQEWRDL